MKLQSRIGKFAIIGIAAISTTATVSSSAFTCRVSGHGGCAQDEGGICVGAGVHDSDIILRFDTRTRQLSLNKIKGTIGGDDPIEAPGDRTIDWRFGIIGLSNFRARRDGKHALHVTLTDYSTELEFLCPQ